MRTKQDKRTIEYVSTSSLTPYARNSRTHSPQQVKQIAASIKEFGFTNPVLIDEANGIIAGHGRVMAAEHLQLTEVPCIRLEYLTETQKRAYVIADNKLALNAGWDEEMLNLELHDLHTAGFDVGLIGFDPEELSDLMGYDDKEVVEDEVPDVPEESVTKLGNLWILGQHRLLCGDCTSEENISLLLHNAKLDAVVTDPPYGTGIKAKSGLGNSKIEMNLLGDEDASLARKSFDLWSKRADVQIWWGANYYSDVLPGVSSWAVWDKDHHGMTYADAELAYVSIGGPVRVFRHAWSGMHRASERNVERQHPTQKPVALYEWIFKLWLEDLVLIADPFLGSGTTLIAAEQLGRICYGMELSPQYCDVIVKRWETLTGKKAVLANG